MYGHPHWLIIYLFRTHPLPAMISAMRMFAPTVRATPSGGDLCTWPDVDGMFVQKHLWISYRPRRSRLEMFKSAVRHEIYLISGCGPLTSTLISDVNVSEVNEPFSTLWFPRQRSGQKVVVLTRTQITSVFAESCMRYTCFKMKLGLVLTGLPPVKVQIFKVNLYTFGCTTIFLPHPSQIRTSSGWQVHIFFRGQK